MAKITDSLVSAFVDVMTTKEKKPSESYVFGIAQNTGDKKIRVLVDGGSVWYEMPSAVKVKDNDRVAIMIKNRKGTVISNITNPSMNAGASTVTGKIATAGPTIYSTTVESTSASTTATTPVLITQDRELLTGELMTDDLYDVIKMGVDTQVYDYDEDAGALILRDVKTQLQVPMIKCENLLNTSDRNLKKDIEDTDESNALGKVNQIRHRKFKWKFSEKEEPLGYIAQEMAEIDPNLALEYGGGWGVDTTYLIHLMSKAIQELSAEVDELRKEVKRLGETKHN